MAERTYTADDLREIIVKGTGVPCEFCLMEDNSDCAGTDCNDCANTCPCKVCAHNYMADTKSLSYGDKFTLKPVDKLIEKTSEGGVSTEKCNETGGKRLKKCGTTEARLEKREDFLEAARKATVDRGGSENTLPLIAKMWSALFGIEVTPSMVASAMIALKLARIANGHEAEDSFVDIAGYAAIGGEAFSQEKC